MNKTQTGRKKWRVRLDESERGELKASIDAGRGLAERRRRAQILLLANEAHTYGGRIDADIVAVVDVSIATVERVRRRCVEEGLEATLERRVQANRKPRKLDGAGEAARTMIDCSDPPEGRAGWTLTLLGERLVEMGVVESISTEKVWGTLKNSLKPWQSHHWCIPPRKNADFVAAMEDVLDIYHRDFDDDTVLVCVDEVSKQLTKEVRTAVPMEPGQPARVDCEYERNGTANRFMVCAPLLGWRHVKVTERRTTADFATLLADLADIHFPNRKIVLVMDNRNTPKHGSWLNIAESEIRVLSRQCLSRRLADRETLTREVAAWPAAINADPRPVKWRFTAAEARIKLHSLYPATQ